MVEEAGFEVVEAADAGQAVELLEKHLDIRIVFTDIDMPRGLDGIRLAALIRDRWPPIEIILTSGGFPPKPNEMPERGVFFAKPFQPEQVVNEMHRMTRAIS
ncbi:response regulator [Lichenicola cladoniae]|nr:response regulator [Lichenicola cladoniae]